MFNDKDIMVQENITIALSLQSVINVPETK